MNRIDRLVAILTTLQSKKSVTADFLSDKYAISVRTVYRDLRALNEIGVPIVFEDNKGYSILKGFFLPPISLTSEEANSLILISTLSEKFTDKTTQKHVENAMSKIKAVLGSSNKDKADALQSQIRVYKPASDQEPTGFLTQIQNAITKQTGLIIEYLNNNTEQSTREIEPIGLTFYSNQWHLIAWCWKRNAYRDFKVAQIKNLIISHEPFKKKDHYSINDYIKSLT